MRLTLLLVVLSAAASLQGAQADLCEPGSEVRAAIDRAAAVTVTDVTAFDRNIAPFQALRKRYPRNLFVHERYQDAVQEHGIEGHLRALTEEYQAMAAEHPDDVMYSYLSARSLVGRSTPAAISSLNEIVSDHPDFAPAHRVLAEIYASEAFRDPEKAASEREKFLGLCSGSGLRALPPPVPEPTLLIDQAEKMLANHGDPVAALEIANQGIRVDEWRLQRVRPFDWYSPDFKRQIQQELQQQYWRFWAIQVRCDRLSGHTEKAAAEVRLMEERAARVSTQLAPVYWEAQSSLARVYIEQGAWAQAEARINTLSQFLSEHPDAERSARLDNLRRLMSAAKK